ncbi:MAG: sulfatase-like hydrolase/transferase [Acidobacteriota bacterium]|nr:sulfatase-like hydrolase/transferase [Acidobacteriota bacterium]
MSAGIAAGNTIPALASEGAPNTLSFTSKPRNPQRPPNVIYMICDDLGYGDLGSYGSMMPTPNLDRMAADGLRLTHYNSAHPICSASRAALLTGRYGHRSNTRGAFGPNSPTGTSLDETLLSNLFHDAGYSTKAIGKWHLGDKPEYLPTNRGFDSYYGVPYSDDMYPLPLIRDTKILEKDTDRTKLTPRYTEEAVRYIEERDDKPFFLYLAFSYPHDPARASERFRGKTPFGEFGDAVAEIDWSAGEVISAVERKGLSEDTLICFSSDHGPWYQGSPGLLRGRKASTFEGGFRVPFLAKWPGVIPPCSVVHQWYSSLDILPSLVSLCGLKLPQKPLDGVDISDLLRGNTTHTRDHRAQLYFSAMGNRGMDLHCIRKGKWKLRVAQNIEGEMYINDRTTGARSSAWLRHPELYDLEIDPAESYDVSKLHPEIIADLSNDLQELMKTFPAPVMQEFAKLQQRKGDITTPPGASPRPDGEVNPLWSWEPPDRR